MDYERNALNAVNEKLLTLFSLIILLFLVMVIILNVKNVGLLVKRNKEEITWQKESLVHNAAEKKQKKNFS